MLNRPTQWVFTLFLVLALNGCGGGGQSSGDNSSSVSSSSASSSSAAQTGGDDTSPRLALADIQLPDNSRFFLGADLSYVNEMEDCGVQYQRDGAFEDPYTLFADAGTNLVRVRLWHTPDWTQYSDLTDVIETLTRAKNAGMPVLLDFHYSDTWADPEKQITPAAWEHLQNDTQALGEALYDYTFGTLTALNSLGLLPEMVQVGNETNNEILQPEDAANSGGIDWARNALLLNKGLQAVADFNREHGTQVERILHIAQPENAQWWFGQAQAAGITDFDIIGLSYYGKWSTVKVDRVGDSISTLRSTYNKDVMIVETAYPWTLQGFDQASNVLGADSLLAEYEATPEGQLQYMIDLTDQVASAGGLGVVYWEPAWVSSQCATLWGTGSHWENAAFFDSGNNNVALPAMSIFSITQ